MPHRAGEDGNRDPAVQRGAVSILDVQPCFGSWGVRGLELGLDDLAAQLGRSAGA